METTVKTAEIRVPSTALAQARQMLADLRGNTQLCGTSKVVDGYWIETHTLGCRNAADEPEDQWEASHEAIRNEYENDGASLVLDDRNSSNFVTITPQASKIAAINYDEMFNGILKILPEAYPLAPDYQSQTKNEIDQQIRWAKQHLKKQDRITWYLRWVRLMMLVNLTGGKENLHNLWVKPEAERMGKITGQGAEAAIKSAKMPLQNKLDHYLGMPVPEIQNTVWDAQSPEDLLGSFKNIEDTWKEEAQKYLTPHKEDEIVVQFQDGWAWWKLGRGYCPEEAAAMGHCGNVQGQYSKDERILSLRQPVKRGNETRWEPHLTFILDGDEYLGEMKGRGNKKPAARYHPYIVALLERTNIVKGVKGGGYLPSHNFRLDDLDLDTQKALRKINPNMVPAVTRLRELGGKPDKELIKRISNAGHVTGSYDATVNGWVDGEWKNPGEYLGEQETDDVDVENAYKIFTNTEEPYVYGYKTNDIVRKVVNALSESSLKHVIDWLKHQGVQIRSDGENPKHNLLMTIGAWINPSIEVAKMKLYDAWKAGITPGMRADVGEQLEYALRDSRGEKGMSLAFGQNDFWNEGVKKYMPVWQAAELTDGSSYDEDRDEIDDGTDDEDIRIDYRYQSPRRQTIREILRSGYADGKDTPSKYQTALERLKPADRKKVQKLQKKYNDKSDAKPFIDWLMKAFPREFQKANLKSWDINAVNRAVEAEFAQYGLPFPKDQGMKSDVPPAYAPRASLLRKANEEPPQMEAFYYNKLLEKLKALPYANDIKVFGSTAQDGETVSSISLVIDLQDKGRKHPAWAGLLKLARQYRGYLNPFIIAEAGIADSKPYYRLWTCNGDATGWIPSRKAGKTPENMKRGVPLATLQPFKTAAIKNKPAIDAHRLGDTVWIDRFEVPEKGKGYGIKAYTEWEASLPKDVKLVRLLSEGLFEFWDKMGFSYVYAAEQGSEYDQYMWKGVNGHPTPMPLETPEEHGYDIKDEPEKEASKTAAVDPNVREQTVYFQIEVPRSARDHFCRLHHINERDK